MSDNDGKNLFFKQNIWSKNVPMDTWNAVLTLRPKILDKKMRNFRSMSENERNFSLKELFFSKFSYGHEQWSFDSSTEKTLSEDWKVLLKVRK